MAGRKSKLESSVRTRPRPLNTKGLAVVLTAGVSIFALWRAQPEDIPKIVEILMGSGFVTLVGWLLAGFFLIGAVLFVTMLCNVHRREVERLAGERDRLQEKLINWNRDSESK